LPEPDPVQRAADPLDGLAEAVRRGDREAIAEVYLRVAPGLRGYLRRRVGHGEVADDLVEQTFVELLEGGHRLRGGGPALRAWLYRAARNNLYDWRKRAERRSDHQLLDRHTSGLSADRDDPALRLDADALDPELEAAMRRLTDDQREVLELRLVACLPLTEVADLTGRTTGAVKQVQLRALRRLASLLEPDAIPDDP
jgi:RNA polymerase sigma-70 factor, ECF subfamily